MSETSPAKMMRAVGNLAVHFWLHTASRLVSRQKPGEGIQKFYEYYRDDKFVALTPAEREQLRDCEKCINCGMCASVCPVYMPAPEAGDYRAPDSITASLSRSFPEFDAAIDAVYNCTQCGACALACPRGINVPELIIMVRRKTVQHSDSLIRGIYGSQLSNFVKTGNIYGSTDQPFLSHRKTSAPIVFFGGCGARAFQQEATMKTLRLLEKLGVDITTVEEACCGSFHRSVGMPHPDESSCENASRIRSAGASTIVVSCPHCLHTMASDPAFNDLKVMHLTTFLGSVLRDNVATDRKVTWHDPCFLGRRGGVYEAPRTIIRETAQNFVELPRNRQSSVCCGAIEGEFIYDKRVSDAMALDRMREAQSTGAEILLTECPACVHRLQRAASGMEVRSFAEFIFDLVDKKQ